VKSVFADTFYWIALTAPTDAHYRAAKNFDEYLAQAQIYTTEEVLI